MVSNVLLHLIEVAEGAIAALQQRLLARNLVLCGSAVAICCSLLGFIAGRLPICYVGFLGAVECAEAARRAQQLWSLVNLQSNM
jgi:hypothetical protein